MVNYTYLTAKISRKTNFMDTEQIFSVVFMPSGRPAPALLTSEETIELLRLEENKGERTLKYWRDEGQLTGIKIGRKIRYPLSELMRFLNEKIAKSQSIG